MAMSTEMVEQWIPSIPIDEHNHMIMLVNGERVVSAVTTDMIVAHMRARLQKWVREKPRWSSADDAIRSNIHHTKIEFMVANDHVYWGKIMNYPICPVCGVSTKVGPNERP